MFCRDFANVFDATCVLCGLKTGNISIICCYVDVSFESIFAVFCGVCVMISIINCKVSINHPIIELVQLYSIPIMAHMPTFKLCCP